MSGQYEGDTESVQVQVSTDTEWFFPRFGPWRLAVGGEVVDNLVDVQNATTDFRAIGAVQYATVRPERPSAASVMTSASATATQQKYSETLSVSSRMWVRVGVGAKLNASSSEALATGQISFTPSWVSSGYHVGTVQAAINPMPVSQSQSLVIPVGGRHPTVGVTALKAAIILQSVTGGTVGTKLAVRLYTTDKEDPGSWMGMETGFSTTEERNTGAQATSGVTAFSDAMWYEAGILVEPSDDDVTATLKATIVATL